MKHTLDTNIIITMNRLYPRDIFGSLWTALEQAIALGEVCICPVVLDELDRGGDDLVEWAKGLPGFVCPPHPQEWDIATAISQKYPGWVQQRKNAADPFVVAHGVHESACIVTEERLRGANVSPQNMGVPNAAQAYGAAWTNLLGFLRSKNVSV